MIEVIAEPGNHISKVAAQLVAAGNDAFTTFNGICVTAPKGSTVESICAEYDRLSELRAKEYRESPEGKQRAAEQKAEVERLQKKADELMKALPNLDFQNVGNLLWWLCEMESPRDRIGVNVDTAKITRTFERHGYTANMCCGPEFDENNRETFAKWIIGQAIAPAYVPMTRSFTEKWNDRFTKSPRLNSGR